jgi:hypothetical protein
MPVWVEGTTDAGQYIRRSLKLNNWERAEEKKRELEGIEEVPPSSKPSQPRAITVRDAFAAFYKDCQARNLNDATLRKYRLLRDLSFANNPSGFISCRNTFIAMMEAVEFCDCYDRAILHDSTLNRALLFERKMRTRSVIVAKVRCQPPF